jgi:hypothetical protein
MKFLIFIFLLLSVIETQAQQTVFNVPSADILDKGKVYLEFDAGFKPTNQAALRPFRHSFRAELSASEKMWKSV